MEDLKYPIGQFVAQSSVTDAQRRALIDGIAEVPAKLRAAVSALSPDQLDTPYRPAGWTVRQVVHHLADSHMNSYVRFKLALTEERPTVKPYDEKRWAELEDARAAPPEVSLGLLEAVHRRWVLLMRSIAPADWARTFTHPESGAVSLDLALQHYEWHGRHHIAHITALRRRMGWR